MMHANVLEGRLVPCVLTSVTMQDAMQFNGPGFKLVMDGLLVDDFKERIEAWGGSITEQTAVQFFNMV